LGRSEAVDTQVAGADDTVPRGKKQRGSITVAQPFSAARDRCGRSEAVDPQVVDADDTYARRA
jgi:hypothetical protein